ncbi:MAG TPA: thioredoxin family protein [Afipia sp.]|uniref:thioredoxin fold domain-containing protein n=1 Tax=unclassified Afipia TaxID=2642050 RepID=UPI0004BCD931|nr:MULTISPECIES: thioredoxin fold domain-containing protein [unclassified Afipia]MAH70284.1 thioredoxin family protein [Afipia sp.]OUX60449.1 MAG: thioredoxin family protein [Afipia sp. TMED4]HAO42221.1 thioredoxin family protein [Afipia sp.]HBF52983.1 thioredoxin family protein [Afipia sp.]HBR47749.1 thioredoxin family protein [Afipia sp.]
MEETTDFPALVDTCEFVYMYHMPGQTLAKTVAAAALSTTVLWCGIAQAAELVMFEQAGCVYCQRWERDVGALYEKTDEAKALPLRRVDIQQQKMSGIALASPVRFTPTFIVVDNGREIGRITGYSNDNAFWGLLDALAAKLQTAARELNRI